MKPPVRLCALLLVLASTSTSAQQVYRQVDRNGKVIFSDQPLAADARPAATAATSAGSAGNVGASTSAPSAASLPYELRQVAQRYPVTLYTTEPCAPCGTGRSLLITRGVPFEERTVKTDDDKQALQRLSGQASLPLLAIGAQQLKGFSDAEWSQYLDAAGYPKSNQLPTGYRNTTARPLTAPSATAAATPAPAAVAPVPPAPADNAGVPTPSNPAGIRF